MNIWQHCLLSERKFGGRAEDYIEVHKFIDSSKFFFYHIKHRLLLHNLWGAELCIRYLGDFIKNSDGKIILIRDISVAHFQEDLSGKAPTLYDWLKDNKEEDFTFKIPDIQEDSILELVQQPYLRTSLKHSLWITYSDFGVYLVEKFLGTKKAKILAEALPKSQKIKHFLENFKFTERWQYSPDKEELKWLKKNE